jgi:hypothetical protein
VVIYDPQCPERLYHLGFLRADNGIAEINDAIEALED